ncbi:MAG TPA: exosortase U [Tepidisphaeraceae bacterium]|nr:exosortase U [Tepidisphaeraceae bacterium]
MRVGHAWAAPALRAGAHFELPEFLAGWQRVTREASIVERPQTEAAQSFVWQYRRGDLIASVALDYPFSGYHELTTCYGMSGWKLGERITEPGRTSVRMTKPAGLEGCLMFAGIDERGEWVAPPPPIVGDGLGAMLAIAGQFGRAEPTYQVQTLLQSYGSLSPQQLSDEGDLFRSAEISLTEQLLAQLPNHGASR